MATQGQASSVLTRQGFFQQGDSVTENVLVRILYQVAKMFVALLEKEFGIGKTSSRKN